MTPIRVKLRELRDARGLSQQALAAAADVRQATISDLERGETGGIDFAVLDRLCAALSDAPLKESKKKETVDVGELLEREEPKRRTGK